jgi:anti-sigma B factor antagonist
VPALSIGSSCVGDVLVLAVSGDIDTLTAPLWVEALEYAVTKKPAAVIVDLTEVHFLATPGMTALVQAQQKATGASLRMAVVADRPTTCRPLKMMGLDVMFREVGQSCDRWLASDGGVGSVVIVEVQPGR